MSLVDRIKIRKYEKRGDFYKAAETAEKAGLKERAMEDYTKAIEDHERSGDHIMKAVKKYHPKIREYVPVTLKSGFYALDSIAYEFYVAAKISEEIGDKERAKRNYERAIGALKNLASEYPEAREMYLEGATMIAKEAGSGLEEKI